MKSITEKPNNGQVNFDDMINDLIKNFIEKMLKGELTEFLNYDKYDSAGKNSGNSRNGNYSRNLQTKYGVIENLEVPRDRNNDFQTALFEPYKRRDNWLEQTVIQMYARGLSTRDIADLIEKMYGQKYSATSVSNLTDIALKEIEQWKKRPLEKRYSVIFIDALSIKIRREHVGNESAYIIIGINEEGYREILDFYIGVTESAALWQEVLMNLKSRGVEQVLLGVMDGLPGLTDSFLKVYPKADVQRCVVHKIRNTLHKVKKKHTDEIVTDLKKIYKAPSREYAEQALNDFSSKWDKLYPHLAQSWFEDKDELFAFYKYPDSIQKSIYTTNWIERANKEIRKRLKTMNSLPNEKAAEKILYLKIIDYNYKWSERRLKGFLAAREKLIQLFEERY
ncbi:MULTISPECIES: IS256 family transposase [Halanaerobium]|jgi:transposase-like protein|uniref:Mutator family transposase n=23 Tax=Halanaerobium TaxID=2330 RepID=A0A1G8TBL8_9FIRM|nr:MULTISPECIES: IS256 family transposase [Halanaerobium]PTW02199.1 transposase-like protein [Halanaerobium saccharolyticum]PTX15745.1 transposase-like protein [Halanaerobium congolense]PTX17796.1 transposase-like protein [Halanaerobium congolense]PXV58922.1 transposase-like protein [Halanaerobium congolense]TDP05055.1 transposase-like protein [Halanaerobium congolense]